ncbi:histidine kinase [Halarcobacter mediterraneus]|uniref:histidine kinase n=1 Tax=Halarcobacter mediterraneus TaxID=2023153 RepID=A0A4Q1AXE2_9BACT|nr:cache domain-containing protein [Halarcobacter mediterraneus]RXK14438.1 histidine kinase [Halarcobacter mediterraneus]
MNNKNELTILNIIKYGPIVFIISLSLIIFVSLYFNYKNTFLEEKKSIEKQYIEKNKLNIKEKIEATYRYIKNEQKTTEKKLQENLKEKVYEAYNIAMNIYKENKHLDKIRVQKMITDALRTIRFNNGRGYFFIYSFDYECIMLPLAPQLEGTNFYNFKEGKGLYLTRNIIKSLENKNESFLKWWYFKPSDMKTQYKKLGFNKKFEPYNWYIGTGEYIDDFKNDIKKQVLDHLLNHEYTKKGYIFIFDYDKNYLLHKDASLINKNAKDYNDRTSYKIVENLISKARKEDSTYINYIQNKRPKTNKPAKKTSYIKNIPNWQWVMGMGFYEEDVNKIIERQRKILENRFENDVLRLFIFSSIFTIILLMISVRISKFLENRFDKYQEQIRKNLEEITHQQNILAQQSKMAAIGTMIGNIAHQWRQPLSLISTAATGIKLKKEIGELDDKELFENLDYINDSTQYLSKTIDDFRNFFTSNKSKKEFSIKEAFENTFNLINVQFKNYDIKIIKDIGKTEIYGIQTELVQVLINILNNSRDELLKEKIEDKLIFIKTYEENNFLFIEIKDNAKGISKEVLEHVFEPYFTTKHQSQGTGIGLYMSQEIIVKHMRGQIEMMNISYTYEKKQYLGAQTIIKLPLK